MSQSPWVRASPSAHEGSHNLCLLTQKVVLITLKEFLACFAKASLKMFNQWISDNQTYWKGLHMGAAGQVYYIAMWLLVTERRYVLSE